MSRILINNLIALAIHAGLCLLWYLLLLVLGFFNNYELYYMSFYPTLILTPLLYILCGRLFMKNTESVFNNILSISFLAVILPLSMVFPWWYHYSPQLALNLPYARFYMFLSNRYIAVGDSMHRFPEPLAVMIWALLPAVTIYLGLVTKTFTLRKRECSPKL